MRSRRVAAERSRGADRSQSSREWVGGRLSPPFFINDRGPEPVRPEIVLWVELPDGVVVGQALVLPEDSEGAVARVLRSTMAAPAVGPPRQPDIIRVADAATAAEVRAEVAGAIPVTVAPAPELDALFDHLIAKLPAPADGSYFGRGRVSAVAVEKLFDAGRSLFAVEPWKIADERQVIRMDIPALGVDGACLSIVGRLGQTRGVMVFPSLDDFEQLLEGIRAGAVERGTRALDAAVLGLTFERATDLPPSMRGEATEHGWPVAGADAYPVVEHRDPDGLPRPLVERDVKIAAACALSLSAFFAGHAALFQSDTVAPVRESYFDDDDREVRLTFPCAASAEFDLTESVEPEMETLPAPAPAEPVRPRAGRNEPCPCGSGRKYKKCHLAADEAEHAGRQTAAPMHALDDRLVNRLARFARQEFGEAWEAHEDDFADPDEAIQLVRPWSVYCFEVDGRTVVDACLDARGHRFSREEQRWLGAQRAAWLSVWEVEAVDPGETLTLHDLLSGARRTVRETRGSRTLVPRDALLGRVVDHDGVALLCGVHQRPLPPFDTAEVVRRARSRLRRRRAVPVERLRSADFGRNLIRYWEEAVEDLDARSAIPPDLRNRDGDPVLLTVDHFEVARENMTAVAARIAELDDAHREGADDDSPVYVFLRPDDPTRPQGEQTIIGRVRMDAGALRIETNSRARADALRERIEAACGSRVRHRAREHTDPLALAKGRGRPRQAPASPEEEHLVAEFKARHYADWIDQPLPALNHDTPREYARTAAGRRAVELLLKDMENREQRARGTPFDFSTIRRRLGIAPR